MLESPAVKLVAPQGFSMSKQQAVPAWCQLAVAHLQSPAPSAEGQQTCHWMRRAIEIVQLLTQQQHSAALGIHLSLIHI